MWLQSLSPCRGRRSGKEQPRSRHCLAGSCQICTTSTSRSQDRRLCLYRIPTHSPSLHSSRDILIPCALAAVSHTNATHHGYYRRQGALPPQSQSKKNYRSHVMHYRSSRSKMKWPRPRRTRPPRSIWVHIRIPQDRARARAYNTDQHNRSIEGQVGKAEERTPHTHIEWRWCWCRFRCCQNWCRQCVCT
jgi:hypothetical protein